MMSNLSSKSRLPYKLRMRQRWEHKHAKHTSGS